MTLYKTLAATERKEGTLLLHKVMYEVHAYHITCVLNASH